MRFNKGLKIALIILSLAAVPFGIFLTIFPDPINLKNQKAIDLTEKAIIIELVKNENQGVINGMSLKGSGTINGKAIIKHGYSKTSLFKIDTVENNFNVTYEGDWYQDNYYLIYKPLTASKGKINLSYKFKGMNNF